MPRRTPFIADQRLRLLDVEGNPRQYLSAQYFRDLRLAADDGSGSPGGKQQADVWKPIARDELWTGIRDGRYPRLVLVTDAGLGKTESLRWLEQRLNQDARGKVAFLMNVSELPDDADCLLGALAKRLTEAVEHARSVQQSASNPVGHSVRRPRPVQPGEAERLVLRLRQQRRLILLFDALDQADDKKVQVLNQVLTRTAWQSCPAVVSGRPYSIEHQLKTQDEKYLFHDYAAWRFVQLEEFDPPQQRRYLGDRRYEAIPEDARKILTIPRVLYYLGEIPEADMVGIRTPCDVFYKATGHMLDDGIAGAKDAQGLTAPDARLLLAAMAFQMTAVRRNYDGLPTDAILDDVIERCRAYDPDCNRKWCQTSLLQLAAMNTFLGHGLLEPGCPKQIFWRDRTLQEYFAAVWLSRYCRKDQAGVEQLWSVICEDFQKNAGHGLSKGEFYWVYRYAAEMPEDGRNAESWIAAMEPLYRPGDGSAEGTRRWTEMLYRSWWTMEAYCESKDESAQRVVNAFHIEFQKILGRQTGDQDRTIAERFLDEFRPIPDDNNRTRREIEFTMGSPQSEADRRENEQQRQVKITIPFELACFPVTNAQYELFDPAYRTPRHRYNSHNECPVVYVRWYDSWAFCRWLGQGYRLPSEMEWEFACRAGTTTAFHFGNSLSSTQADFHGDYPYGGAPKGPYLDGPAPVGSYEPNAWGLYDMHGNVSEWTDSAYSEDPRESTDGRNTTSSARVLRGSSWFYGAATLRSAERLHLHPAYTDLNVGFRVARALLKT